MKNLKKGLAVASSLASLSEATHQGAGGFDYSNIEQNFNGYTLNWDESDRTRQFNIRIQYHPDLNCGECVAGGHNFCWKSKIPGEILADKDYPRLTPINKSVNGDNTDTESRCCYNSQDVAIEHRNMFCENIIWNKPGTSTDGQSEWICSNSYKDTTYGLHVCPFKRSSCGPRSTIDLYKVDDDGAIEIKNLKRGEACTYNIGSVCGAPSFKVQNKTGVEIFFAEWQQDFIKASTPVTNSPATHANVKDASPLQGMPQRNQDFTFEGDGVPGSTQPKTGVYQGIEWKAWGNNNQGNNTDEGKAVAMLGRRYTENDFECKQRNMLISVIAKEDNAGVLLELQSMEFKAVYIKNAFLMAAVTALALFSV